MDQQVVRDPSQGGRQLRQRRADPVLNRRRVLPGQKGWLGRENFYLLARLAVKICLTVLYGSSGGKAFGELIG